MNETQAKASPAVLIPLSTLLSAWWVNAGTHHILSPAAQSYSMCLLTYNALSYSSAFKGFSVENHCPSPFPTHHQPFSTCPFTSNPNADLIHICTPGANDWWCYKCLLLQGHLQNPGRLPIARNDGPWLSSPIPDHSNDSDALKRAHWRCIASHSWDPDLSQALSRELNPTRCRAATEPSRCRGCAPQL
jgi:hypothetical protein